MRGDSGIAGEGRVVDVPKFHSWGKCTMPLTNIDSDWMSYAYCGLRIIMLFIYTGPLSCILGCNIVPSNTCRAVGTELYVALYIYLSYSSVHNLISRPSLHVVNTRGEEVLGTRLLVHTSFTQARPNSSGVQMPNSSNVGLTASIM